MSDTTLSSAFGTFDAENNYTPRQITDRDLSRPFGEEIEDTMVSLKDGQLVKGTVVKIDRDGVLLDVRFKTEGVIPVRELAIKNDVNPHDVVALGQEVEALVVTLEDKEGRLILSKKRAQ